MKKIFYVVLIAVLVIAIGASFYFKNNITKFFSNTAENIAQFKKSDIGAVVNQITLEIFAPTPLNIGGAQNNVVLTEAKIIAQTNAQRFSNGQMPPLIKNEKLDEAARAKANELFKNQYFEHVSPSGVDPGELVKNYGYDYIVTGENLILGNFSGEKELVQDWMDSPGHRANILNDRYADIGVAVVKGTYKGHTVWISVQEFGLPLEACTVPNADIKAELEYDKVVLGQIADKIDVKRGEIDNTGRQDKKYNALIDEYNALVEQYNQVSQYAKSLIIKYNTQVNTFNACVGGK